MGAVLDTDKVWASFLADDILFGVIPASLQMLMRELVDELPEVLKEHLDKSVTFESILLARLKILIRLSQSDYREKMAEALSRDQSFLEDTGLEPSDVTTGVLAIIHIRARRRLQKTIEEVAVASLADPTVGMKLMRERYLPDFKAATLAVYETGSFTIHDLLELQPALLLLGYH